MMIVGAALVAAACGGSPNAPVDASTLAAESGRTAPPTSPAEPAEAEPTESSPTSPAEPTESTLGGVDAAAESTPTPTEAPTDIPEFVPPTGIAPMRIEIPTIGVDAPTIELSLAGEEPEVPTDFDDTGWYTQTRLPGEIGPAVIAGHIDSRSGPAVFARLDELRPGDEIIVRDGDGDSRTFVVIEGAQYPKGDLPDSVFGFGGPEPELRLITCGGTFDADVGHYRDNYVVFARLGT